MSEVVKHYLLRLWCEGEERGEGEGAWRASLRSVRDGSLRTFSDPESLMKFLNDSIRAEASQKES